jgi:hypothetical protein
LKNNIFFFLIRDVVDIQLATTLKRRRKKEKLGDVGKDFDINISSDDIDSSPSRKKRKMKFFFFF